MPNFVQRAPDEQQVNAAPPQKTLKDEGIDTQDPVSDKTAGIIDSVLARNKTLAPFIADKIAGGKHKIAEAGKFKKEVTKGTFETSYRNCFGQNQNPGNTPGFYCPKTDVIHVLPNAMFGTALHEAIHRFSKIVHALPTIAAQTSENFAFDLNEGLTAYFTDVVLNEENLPNHKDSYRFKKDRAKKLIDQIGFEATAEFYFQGRLGKAMSKLNVSFKQVYQKMKEIME